MDRRRWNRTRLRIARRDCVGGQREYRHPSEVLAPDHLARVCLQRPRQPPFELRILERAAMENDVADANRAQEADRVVETIEIERRVVVGGEHFLEPSS